MRFKGALLACVGGLLMAAPVAQAQTLETFSPGKGISSEQFSKFQSGLAGPRTLGLPPQSVPMSRGFETLSRLSPRIVGGRPATIQQNPWQVALIYGEPFSPEPIRQQFCGGSVVANNWILTAAHCVGGNGTVDQVDIVLGTGTYRYGGERIKVADVKVHPGYNAGTQQNDIALIKLAAPTTLGRPAPLAAATLRLAPNTNTTVSGWGYTAEGGPGSDILLSVDVPVVATADCNKPDAYSGRILPGMLCAGVREGGLDSCQGDSGGPLTSKIDGVATLVGVVSWGEGCARRLRYGVYSEVSVFRSWIDSVMASN